MNFFEKQMLYAHPSVRTGESTPSYLLHRYSRVDDIISIMVDMILTDMCCIVT